MKIFTKGIWLYIALYDIFDNLLELDKSYTIEELRIYYNVSPKAPKIDLKVNEKLFDEMYDFYIYRKNGIMYYMINNLPPMKKQIVLYLKRRLKPLIKHEFAEIDIYNITRLYFFIDSTTEGIYQQLHIQHRHAERLIIQEWKELLKSLSNEETNLIKKAFISIKEQEKQDKYYYRHPVDLY